MDAGTYEIGGRDVEVSNTGKLFFPEVGVTKGDLVAHYRDVAEVMLPHLAGRPLTLQRYPDGIDAEGWYQKDASDHFPDWLERIEVARGGKRGPIHQVTVADPAGLVYLANQATISFHVWTSRGDRLVEPDVVVVDLDPPEGIDLAVLRDGVRAVRDGLQEIGLVPYLQATGSKGYHVVAPIERGPDFETVRDVADRLVAVIAGRQPESLTTHFRKEKREGRIFLDVGRNAYAQTFVAPYSVRVRPQATVATPLDWDELGRADPDRYTVRNIQRRLGQKTDPWAGIWDDARPLSDAAAALDDLEG